MTRLLPLLAVLAAGCSKADDVALPLPAAPIGADKAAAKSPASKTWQTATDAFVFAISGEPETLDPGRMRGVNESKVCDQMFEGLLEFPLGNGAMAPGVAERHEVSPDGRTYTFHLRADAKWSNGDAVTAADFRYSWLRVLDKKLASPYADILFVIDGAAAYFKGAEPDPKSVGIEVIDAHTLRVRLAYVAPYFVELAAFHTLRPVHRATVERHGDKWTRPENIVSNGPYQLVEWRPGKHLKMTVNPHHWMAAKLKIRKLTIRPIQENTSVINQYKSGQLDWTGATDLPSLQIGELSRRDDYREDPYIGTYFFRFNVEHGPLKDRRVRRALSFAVDRAAIVKVIKLGFTATGTYVPRQRGYTPPTNAHAFDPVQAKALLSQAGYDGGVGFPRLKLLYNTQENHKQVAEMVQEMWKTHLGIEVELVNQEWKVYLKSLQSQDYQLARSGWIGDYHDPMTFLDMWITGSGNNNTGGGSSTYDGLIERARREPDAAKRMAILSEAETLLLEEAPVLPIKQYARAYLLNPSVSGFAPHTLNQHPVRYISKE